MSPRNPLIYTTPRYRIQRMPSGSYVFVNTATGHTVAIIGADAERFYEQAAHRTVAALEECVAEAMR